MSFKDKINQWRDYLGNHWTVPYLKALIVLWAIGVIILVLFFIDNPFILAGIFLYEALP